MNILLDFNQRPVRSPYSARNMAKPVNFYHLNRHAKMVRLIGDFNGWNQDAHPMRRREDGCWFVEVPLTRGHHSYLFLVDGVPTLDSHSGGIVRIGPFGKASLLAVS